MRRLWALALLCALTAAARADGKKEAQKLFKQGNAAVDAGDYVGAFDKFRAAYAAFPSPKILLNVGTVLQLLGKNVEAIKTYEKYLADPQADKKKMPEVERALSTLNHKIAHLRITVDVPGTRVFVDGRMVGEVRDAITVRVDPGSHAVVARKDGLPAYATNVDVQAAQDLEVTMTLAPKSAEPTRPPEPVKPPDPKLAVPAPAPEPLPAPGPEPRAHKRGGPPGWAPWVTLGAAALAAGAGGYFGNQALDRDSDFDDRKSAGSRSTISFAAAGVLAAGAGGLFIWRFSAD